MGDDEDLDARFAALEREVADERAAEELKALEAVRREQRELDELRGRLARLQREHRAAFVEVLGEYSEAGFHEAPGAPAAPATRPKPQPVRPAQGTSEDTSVTLSVGLYARLDQLAGEQGQSVQALCESVLDGYMRSRKAPPPSPQPTPEPESKPTAQTEPEPAAPEETPAEPTPPAE